MAHRGATYQASTRRIRGTDVTEYLGLGPRHSTLMLAARITLAHFSV